MDDLNRQVHEEASYEWNTQSRYRYTKFGSKSYDFNSRDQDMYDISSRTYVWSSGRGEIDHDEEDDEERRHMQNTFPWASIFAPEERTTLAVSDFLPPPAASFRRSGEATKTPTPNTEGWSPYPKDTPVPDAGYQWNSDDYPELPEVQRQGLH